MDTIHVVSNGPFTAACSNIVLRMTSTTRLLFRPELVENPGEPKAAVHGVFVFQRKGPNEVWADIDAVPFSTLKKGDARQLILSASEVRTFFDELAKLYRLHEQIGVPEADGRFVRVADSVMQLAGFSLETLRQVLKADAALGPKLLTQLLAWATEDNDPSELVRRLVELGPASLRKLNAAVGVQILKAALATWRERGESTDEEFWQQALTENSIVLERVFSWPATIIKGKAYVGGKSVLNTGGGLVDFLVKNRLTNNAALVELKTPGTPLLGREYRSGVFAPSEDLAGAVVQVLHYRHSLQQEYLRLQPPQPDTFECFAPECVVIIGSVSRCLTDGPRRESFELYRAQLPTVRIITFDEMIEKTDRLVTLLESSDQPDPIIYDDDIPF